MSATLSSPTSAANSRPAHLAVAIALAVLLPLAAALIGGYFTGSSVSTWYLQIAKPSWTPPGSVIGAVWTVLFIAMGVSLYLVIKDGLSSRPVKLALGLFVLQIALNIGWSWAFFYMRSPALGVMEIVLLWLAISATIYLFWGISKPAAALLMPYLAWVTFAAFLTYSVWRMNI